MCTRTHKIFRGDYVHSVLCWLITQNAVTCLTQVLQNTNLGNLLECGCDVDFADRLEMSPDMKSENVNTKI